MKYLEPDLDNASEGSSHIVFVFVLMVALVVSWQTPDLETLLCWLPARTKRKGSQMDANPQFLATTAQVDRAAIQALPNSHQKSVTGFTALICVC